MLSDGDVLCLRRRVEEEINKKKIKKNKKNNKSHFTVLATL